MGRPAGVAAVSAERSSASGFRSRLRGPARAGPQSADGSAGLALREDRPAKVGPPLHRDGQVVERPPVGAPSSGGLRAPAAWRQQLGAGGVGKIIVLVGLMGWLYADHLVRLFRYWQRPDWSHGFLIPLFSLYLVHARRSELFAAKGSGSAWGLVLMLGSIGAYAAAIRMKIEYPQPMTIVTMIAGLVLLLRGWRTLWLTWFPIAFLVLAMPPPERLYRAFTQPLQQMAATLATAILNVLPGADVEHAGINIAFFMADGTTGSFTVAGACSGMRSLMAFVALGLAMAYFTPRPVWHRIAMAAVVVPVALFCNVVRVVATGAFQMYGRSDLSTGTPHTLLGLLLFGLGFVIYMGVLWVLDHAVIEEPERGDDEDGTTARGTS